MKKILVVALGAILLTGCGSSEKDVSCKFAPSESTSAKVVLTYDGDKKITKMSLQTGMEVPSFVLEDKDTLKSFKESLNKTTEKYKREGVKVDIKLDEKKSTANMNINIDKAALTKENSEDIGFYYTKDVNKAVKKYKEQGFTCGKVE